MASEEQRIAIEVRSLAQGWDAEKQQGWRGKAEQQVLDHVDRKHGIHPKDIHRYHERDEDDTDSQDESSHACASHLLSDGAILHLFTLRSSLYMHTLFHCHRRHTRFRLPVDTSRCIQVWEQPSLLAAPLVLSTCIRAMSNLLGMG